MIDTSRRIVVNYCGNAVISESRLGLQRSHDSDVVLAWIVFEYILTFTDEVQLFWRRKLTGATALFLVNRYTLLLYFLIFVYVAGIPALNTVSPPPSMPFPSYLP